MTRGEVVRYLSVCSGIEAASVAWHPLGWEPMAFSEIDPFPSAVLAHHWPHVPNLGDMTAFKEWNIEKPDVLVGGTPCQSFSVAGLRKGLDDPRGNLMLVYLGLVEHFAPRWVVWENVPGVLSSNRGRDFGTFLGALGELGYGWAYRILDAQFFGVPQRRRRVFVVGYLGDWRPPAAVLFERESLRGNPTPSREAGEEVAHALACHAVKGGDPTTDNYVTHVQDRIYSDDGAIPAHTAQDSNRSRNILTRSSVRRLTVRECERLMGLPDDYTLIPYRGKPAADGPRYKALGNSMAVPVMAWIGKRIAATARALALAALSA